jgi:hypothetical protein
MSSILSDIEVSNMSLLTYGAIGITSIVLAVVTIFDKDGGPEMASVVEPEVLPAESSVTGLFSNNANPEEEVSTVLPEIFSNNDSQQEGDSEETVSTEQTGPQMQDLGDQIQEPTAESYQKVEENERLMGGKKRKHKSKTKKYGKSRGKKQRKTRSKV